MRRSKYREEQHRAAADLADPSEMSFLEANRVKTPTAHRYFRVLQLFIVWAALHALGHLPRDQLDRLLVEYFEHLYFTGENHDAGDKCLAAI